MFRGLTAVNTDEKGRIRIPADYHPFIAEQENAELIMTIDTEDKCLLLYPLNFWRAIEQKLEQLPSFHPATRRIQRLLIGHANELEMDKNGRILIPQLLREYAELDKTVMLVGQGKKIELWGESHWQMKRDNWLTVNENSEVPPELLSISL